MAAENKKTKVRYGFTCPFCERDSRLNHKPKVGDVVTCKYCGGQSDISEKETDYGY